ncbi:DUF3299 domain-containing protein [Vibrio barjaei]|jgi:hypothetical protein|uniref:DUF3299 domain-containing protein n=1 Tax=Vibrio barjaei TaxID=1676683 RepID=UPI0007BB697D|nr:DUF3299 domain-containing protein [Vibrio barjaei]MCY9873904.1 DUF3299 domain-containing protein [Vibrio barjaei]OIN24957.1 hypothetical protein AWH66_2018515 [Vibrio barjaei]
MRSLVTLVSLSLLFMVQAHANDWQWQDLSPTIDTPTYQNKFASFTPTQRYDLMTIVDYQNKHEPERAELETSYREALIRFAKNGINILALIEEQKQIDADHSDWNMNINPKLIGKKGRLPGFIVPLEFDELIVTEFILVPTAGACIHTPPPPGNQMVLVSYPQGIEFRGLYSPVWVDGTLMEQSTASSIELSDGNTEVISAYTMTADNVTVYEQ